MVPKELATAASVAGPVLGTHAAGSACALATVLYSGRRGNQGAIVHPSARSRAGSPAPQPELPLRRLPPSLAARHGRWGWRPRGAGSFFLSGAGPLHAFRRVAPPSLGILGPLPRSRRSVRFGRLVDWVNSKPSVRRMQVGAWTAHRCPRRSSATRRDAAPLQVTVVHQIGRDQTLISGSRGFGAQEETSAHTGGFVRHPPTSARWRAETPRSCPTLRPG